MSVSLETENIGLYSHLAMYPDLTLVQTENLHYPLLREKLFDQGVLNVRCD